MHGAPSTPWQMWNQAKGFATLTMRSRTGRDREDESGPGIVPLETTEKAVTMASTDVAVTRWRLPLVPRETDELPSPTDRKSLWIFIQHGCSAFLAEGASRSEPVLPPLTLHFNVAQPSQVGCSERLRANQTESKVMYGQRHPQQHPFHVVDLSRRQSRSARHLPTRSWSISCLYDVCKCLSSSLHHIKS